MTAFELNTSCGAGFSRDLTGLLAFFGDFIFLCVRGFCDRNGK